MIDVNIDVRDGFKDFEGIFKVYFLGKIMVSSLKKTKTSLPQDLKTLCTLVLPQHKRHSLRSVPEDRTKRLKKTSPT